MVVWPVNVTLFSSRVPRPTLTCGSDDAVMADANFFVEFRAGINDGGMGYDCGHTNQLSGMNMEVIGKVENVVFNYVVSSSGGPTLHQQCAVNRVCVR